MLTDKLIELKRDREIKNINFFNDGTTSKDDLMFNNKYLYEEGSYYVLPITSSRWLNTSNGKYYNSGDKVLVNHGMHFVEVK